MTTAHRVLARYIESTTKQADALWLPDLLGAKKKLSDLAIKEVKEAVRGGDSRDGKAPAGGIVYFLLKAIRETSTAEKLWNLLDASAGLSTDRKWEDVAWRIVQHLDHAPALRKMQAAGLCVDVLMRTRQQTKAQRVNAILAQEFAKEIAEAQAGGGSSEWETPHQRSFSNAEKLRQWSETPEVAPLVHKALAATGSDPGAIARLIHDAFEDANIHKGAAAAESLFGVLITNPGDIPEPTMYGSDVSSALDWSLEPIMGWAMRLLEAIGAGSSAKRLGQMLIKAYPEVFEDRL